MEVITKDKYSYPVHLRLFKHDLDRIDRVAFEDGLTRLQAITEAISLYLERKERINKHRGNRYY